MAGAAATPTVGLDPTDTGLGSANARAVYRDLLVAYGWGRWRAWIEWTALRVCGASHWTSRTEKEK